MTLSVAELQPALHDLFCDSAHDLARDAGFCRRQRLLTGPAFAQTLVFSFLAKPDSTLEDFADFAADHLDVAVSPQAFQQRFGPAAVTFLGDLLRAALDRCFSTPRPALLPLLRHFAGVYVRDASVLRLPDGLADFFPARSGPDGSRQAAVKLVLEMEVRSGQFTALDLLPATDNEKSSPVAAAPLPPGALLLEDMGFLAGDRLQDYVDQGVYVLTRVPHWTAFFEPAARGRGWRRLDLLKWLRQAGGNCRQRRVSVFRQQKLALRLLATRVPDEVARQRRARVRADAKKRGRPVSQRKLELCDWTILVTNAPAALLSVFNAWEVRAVRWQIELVFKAFKSEGGLERTAARGRWRVLGELYAKVLAWVVQQWCLLSAGYVMLRHSLRRVSRRVRRRSGALLQAVRGRQPWPPQIEGLSRDLRRCGIGKRRRKPSTFDRLAALDAEFRQGEEAA